MARRWLVTVGIVAALVGTVARAQTSRASDLYQEALVAQEAKGDLRRALELYRTIVDKYAADAAIAPKALLEMATCYERLGKSEDAEASYRSILTKYGTSAVASTARARLNEPQKQPEMVLRRVDGYVGEQVAPNGKFFTLVDWDTGDVAIREVGSKTHRRITANGKWTDNYAEDTLPSPDSKMVAYPWWNNTTRKYELRVIGRDGGQPRVVKLFDDGVSPGVLAWTPDNRGLILSLQKGALTQPRARDIVSISLADGAVKPLAQFPPNGAFNLSISPDARWIAFDRSVPGRLTDIFIVPIGGGPETPVTSNPANDSVVDWLRDGSGLLFASDRGSGAFGIWVAPLADGRPSGDAISLRPEIGRVGSMGITTAGEFYFQTVVRTDNVRIATIDPATGKLVGRPVPVEGRYVSGQLQAAWSPDGTRLAYVQTTAAGTSRANLRNPGGQDAAKRLAIQDVATGNLRLLDPGLRNFHLPSWTPDGQSVVVNGNAGDASSQGLYRINLDTGAASAISIRDGGSPEVNRGSPEVSRDGKLVFFKRPGTPEAPASVNGAIWVRDLASGSERSFVDGPINTFALSPDGRTIAATNGAPSGGPTLMLIPVDGGTPRPLPNAGQAWTPRPPIGWSADGKSVFQLRYRDDEDELWQVPIDGSEPRFTGIKGSITRISAHPDGRRLALSITGATTEIWAMKNLPTFKR